MRILNIIVLISIFLGLGQLSFAAREEQSVFSITLRYFKGEISLEKAEIIQAYFDKEEKFEEGNYRLDLLSSEEKVLYPCHFDFRLEILYAPRPEWFDEQGRQIYFPTEEEAIIKIEEALVTIFAPYLEEAIEARIFFVPENKEVLRFSLRDMPKDPIPLSEKVIVEEAEPTSIEEIKPRPVEEKPFPEIGKGIGLGFIGLIIVAIFLYLFYWYRYKRKLP